MGKWLGEQHSNFVKHFKKKKFEWESGGGGRSLLMGVGLGRVASCELWMEDNLESERKL